LPLSYGGLRLRVTCSKARSFYNGTLSCTLKPPWPPPLMSPREIAPVQRHTQGSEGHRMHPGCIAVRVTEACDESPRKQCFSEKCSKDQGSLRHLGCFQIPHCANPQPLVFVDGSQATEVPQDGCNTRQPLQLDPRTGVTANHAIQGQVPSSCSTEKSSLLWEPCAGLRGPAVFERIS